MRRTSAGLPRHAGRVVGTLLFAASAACGGGDAARRTEGDAAGAAASESTATGVTSMPDTAARPSGTADGEAPRCDATQLAARRAGSDAGAGQRGVTYLLRNAGSRSCRLGGTPSMYLVDSSGARMAPPDVVPTDASVDDATTLDEPLLLAPGDSAAFQITYTGIAAGALTCRVATAVGITPPGSAATITLADTLRVCGPTVHVRPILHGLPDVPR